MKANNTQTQLSLKAFQTNKKPKLDTCRWTNCKKI